MKVIDLHSDLITDIALRRARGETNVLERIHVPGLRKGGITGLICVLWVEPLYRGREYERFRRLIQYAFSDIKESSSVRIVTSLQEAENANKQGKIFIVLGLEGLTFIRGWRGDDHKQKLTNALHELTQYKVSHAILAWNEMNFLASGTGAGVVNRKKGLTSIGEFAVIEMERRGWSVDVSHLDEATFWAVDRVSRRPLLSSHSNAKKLCPHERNLTDAQIKAVAATGGLIGVNAYGPFVNERHPTLERFVDHITYIADLVGIEHVGLGFDFLDYLQGYQLEGGGYQPTKGLESVEQVPNLADHMVMRGFHNRDIEKVCFRNAMEHLFTEVSLIK